MLLLPSGDPRSKGSMIDGWGSHDPLSPGRDFPVAMDTVKYTVDRVMTTKGTSRVVLHEKDGGIVGFCRQKSTGRWTGFLSNAEYWDESAVKVGKGYTSDIECISAVLKAQESVSEG